MTEHCDFCDVSIPAYKKMCDECTRMRENVKRVCESINTKNVR
jgi:predicted nucleic acid-binding Zn ribbon protein